MTSFQTHGGKGSKPRKSSLSIKHRDIAWVLANGNAGKGPMTIKESDLIGLPQFQSSAVKTSDRFVIQPD